MGYPMTTLDLYSGGEFRACINIVGDATAQWPQLADVIDANFDVDEICVYDMKKQ